MFCSNPCCLGAKAFALLAFVTPVASVTPISQERHILREQRREQPESQTKPSVRQTKEIIVAKSGVLLSSPPSRRDSKIEGHQGATARATHEAQVVSAGQILANTSTMFVNTGSKSSPLRRAFKGGLAGMAAGVLQVFSLMWFKTAMNRQYFQGGTLAEAFQSLWTEGGIARFYQGVGFALFQVPLARFGDTFVQTATEALFGKPGTQLSGLVFGLLVATLGACWRLGVAPLDTLKVAYQVHGAAFGKIFAQRFRVSGILELWSGAAALFLVIWAGTFPFWTVYNCILEYWPDSPAQTTHILRNGLAGMLGAMAADVVSNGFRVLKVTRQATTLGSIGFEGYVADVKEILLNDGHAGLLCRGLGTRLMLGAVQGTLFSVAWNLLLGSWMFS